MPHYLSRGSVPKKRHTAHRTSPGFKSEGIYYEEVITTQGFSRAHSIAYHLKPPTRVKHIEPAGTIAVDVAEQAVLRHHHLKSGTMPTKGDPVTGRVPMFTNADVTMWRCRPAQPQAELYRNALADEVIFVHKGAGRLLTAFGVLPFKPFDYVVIPRCTTYKFDFDPGTQPDLLVVESAGQVSVPAKYLNHDGQLRLGAPYSERDLHGPTDLFVLDEEKDTPVVIKDGPRLSRYVLASHPFDVIGWDGQVYPFTFNADDFEPITGTIHQPPPIHLTFETPGFVLCTFAPRMLDTHPDAIKVPYAHSNVESDEVLYYVRGKFGSRRGVEEASFTLHPHGIPHGPHPGTIVASRDVKWTDELAVMVDTFRPLFVTKQSLELDDPKYPYSWLD
ncbi:homogentisate 1,2-dioxygenase [Gemmata sp. G18]|uniref:Homogentisate 1,2-dioxygenase n=1 Tax=Gemmata palustris TaxID=2822762 RepID=A0ABS5BUS5_9BACT|nr:homogentisate 1,2-dioxygenase [Gemmata palustris]MBP3957192.1 homogentisate 1,2-dioxygenase [Gemmata palustris]